MKYSTQARILAELALVRICHLEDLEELSSLIVQLQSGQLQASGQRRSGERGAAAGATRRRRSGGSALRLQKKSMSQR